MLLRSCVGLVGLETELCQFGSESLANDDSKYNTCLVGLNIVMWIVQPLPQGSLAALAPVYPVSAGGAGAGCDSLPHTDPLRVGVAGWSIVNITLAV